MKHSSQIVQISKPVSGLLAVTIRCCDDPKTDSVVTLHLAAATDEEVEKAIEAHRAKVEELHAHDDRGHALMKKLNAGKDCGCP